MSADRQNIRTIQKMIIGVAESNDGVRILTEKLRPELDIEVSAHARYQFGKNIDKCSPTAN